MKTVEIEIPSMYGDHHVLEVRKILLEIPGVEDVYASSNFHIAQVSYDPVKVNDLQIMMKLDQAGYLGEWTIPVESGIAANQATDKQKYFRHSSIYNTTRSTTSFSQKVAYSGRPLWPCPGMGTIQRAKEE